MRARKPRPYKNAIATLFQAEAKRRGVIITYPHVDASARMSTNAVVSRFPLTRMSVRSGGKLVAVDCGDW